tara:strand:+ start:129 stop:557 length:429 start_codon:yes stop_codon:yes gene_type:complete
MSMDYKILSKFIKDLSFEIPDSKAILSLEQNITKYNVVVNITAKAIKNNIIQVDTIFQFNADEILESKAHIEINLASLVRVDESLNKDKAELEKIILISVPNEVYPTIFQIFKNLLKECGMDNLNIKKEINFEELYQKNKKN